MNSSYVTIGLDVFKYEFLSYVDNQVLRSSARDLLNILSIQSNKKMYSDHSGVVILNDMEVQDIDNESDWKLAELKYQLIINNKF